MNFRDQRLVCSVCGKPFIYTVTEQRQRHQEAPTDEAGKVGILVSPTRCPSCRIRDPETGRWVGRIKWYSHEKGYGFIARPDGEEVFFHRSQVVDTEAASLEEGTAVSFEQIETDRGAEAQQVQVEA
jgi:cold shock protein